MGVQFLKTEDGGELVVLSRRDYTMLLARAGDEEAEDRAAEILIREAQAAREARGGTVLPAWFSGAILRGEHPLAAARERAGLSLAELSEKSGVEEDRLAAAESGSGGLDAAALERVASLLAVEADWLTD